MNPIVREDLLDIISSPVVDWSKFKGSTVLVSGASGMLPAYMVGTLLVLNEQRRYGIKIAALVRNPEKARKVFSGFPALDSLSLITQDVSDTIDYDGPLDYIIHAASQAAPSYYGTDPVGTFKANTLGTVNMLELARAKNVRGFLYFSTGAVYGDVGDESTDLVEDKTGSINPLEVRNCYAESKRAGENACVCYHHQYNVPVKIVRIFHTFGPYVNLNDGRVFSDFCKNIINNQDIVLKSDGSAKRQFCYAADAVTAYFKVLLDGEPATAYNVGGDRDHEISIKELSEKLVALFPERQLKVVYDIDPDDPTYTEMRTPQNRISADLSRIRSLGWRQKYSAMDCFARTINAIEHTPLLSICIPTYKRAAYLEKSLEAFRQAFEGHDYDVELLVSDNDSPDNTPEVVKAAMDKGLKCRYVRNERNLGPDGNFLSCFRKASGKYIWLLGDDDYLIPEKFPLLYDALQGGDYGLVHLMQYSNGEGEKLKSYTVLADYLEDINAFITFMSANIIRREALRGMKPEKYMDSYLLQVPFYLRSALTRPENLIVLEPILDPGHAYSTNGGYNIFLVFARNLGRILHELVDEGHLTRKEYARIVKKIYGLWLCEYVIDILILKRTSGFNTDKAWRILFKEYWNKPYFYYKTARRTAGKLLLRQK